MPPQWRVKGPYQKQSRVNTGMWEDISFPWRASCAKKKDLKNWFRQNSLLFFDGTAQPWLQGNITWGDSQNRYTQFIFYNNKMSISGASVFYKLDSIVQVFHCTAKTENYCAQVKLRQQTGVSFSILQLYRGQPDIWWTLLAWTRSPKANNLEGAETKKEDAPENYYIAREARKDKSSVD